ncbi:MAG: PEP-CTERM sorting domain-containing protein, partial [Microcoleus sp. SIO2G3]|nr:PEP-CTERM sorting domain-containing protein [Microcoleus sp. SIO2G3]
DFAFVTLSATVLADTYSTFPDSLIDLTKFRYQTGYQTFNYTFTIAGTYTLGIGVAELGDGLDDSGLLVDDVVIASTPPATEVPEPASVLGILVLGALGFASRRAQQQRKDNPSH